MCYMFLYFHALRSFHPVTLPWLRKALLQAPSPALFRLTSLAQHCLGLETDACHGKELPGRVIRGPGDLWEIPSATFFSCSSAGKLCYLLRREE